MGKRYIHTVDDAAITTGILFKASAEENPGQYPVGGLYVLANGVLLQISANDGTTVTVQTVTVSVPA